MKLLILSYDDTGQGRSAAAAAVASEWRRQGHECEIMDNAGLNVDAKPIAPNANSSIAKNFPYMMERSGPAGERERHGTPIAANLAAKKLSAYISEQKFDAVLCTHLYPMETLTFLKQRAMLPCPCFGLLTDYACAPFFEETELDMYFTPQDEVTQACVSRGMPCGRFVETGIPVHRSFAEEISKQKARNYLMIAQDETMYCILSAGLGMRSVMELCKWILLSDAQAGVYVMTSRGDGLNERLKRTYGIGGQVHPVVFTEKFNVYLKAADVVLMKPEGIPSTQAAVAGVPTVHTMPLQGSEAKNAAFFSSHKLAEFAETLEQAAKLAKEIVSDQVKAAAIRMAQKKLINPNAAEDIVRQIRLACC